VRLGWQPQIRTVRRIGEGAREGAANNLLALGGMSRRARTDLRVLLRNLRVRTSATAPRGCEGAFTRDPPTVRLDGRGGPLAALELFMHEVGHLACWVFDLDDSEDDEAATDVGSRILLPGPLMAQAVDGCGLDAWKLLGEFHDVRPSTVFARAACAVGGAAIFLRGGSRIVRHAPGFKVPPQMHASERILFDSVRAAGRPCRNELGMGAWPYSDGPDDRGGVVILVPADVEITETAGLFGNW
jgi:hypothetical protein